MEFMGKSHPIYRKCSACLATMAAGEFYSKGARLESICKSCSLKRKKAHYKKKRSKKANQIITKLNSGIQTTKLPVISFNNEPPDEFLSILKSFVI